MDCTHPLRAGRRRPQLFLDLLSDLLHRHLGLLDGSLGRVEPGGGGDKVTIQIIVCDHEDSRMLTLCCQEASKSTGRISAMTAPPIHFI